MRERTRPHCDDIGTGASMTTYDQPSLWRFDAWDSRAGLAFVSYRPADNYQQAYLDLDIPTVFIGPPAFQPEQLASRAVALAACRGTFQQGLFAEGSELGFGQLSEIIEQIRRAYIAGSALDHGDDGGGGNTQSPPVIPPDGGLEGGDNIVFLQETDWTGLRHELEHLVGVFTQKVYELQKSKIDDTGTVPCAEFVWNSFLQTKPSRGDDIVERGALRILWELLMRYQPDGHQADYFKWAEASSRFARACVMLKLWKSLGLNGHISFLLKAAPHLTRELANSSPYLHHIWERALDGDERAGAWLLWWVLVPEEQHDLEWSWKFYGAYPSGPSFFANDYWSDMPMRDLGYWPVPKELANLANHNYARRASVADLLASFLACPQKFYDAGHSELWATLEICLFAAAYLTRRDSPVPITVASDERAPSRPHNFEFYEPAMALGKGWRWLSEQLPRVAFIPRVEEMIFEASTLRYRAELVAAGRVRT
jgi:hypothetical protein